MGGAIQGVSIIAVLIILGWLLQRFRALPSQSSGVLSAFVYWAATPALLFSVISQQDLSDVLGAPFLAAVASGIGAALVFLAMAAGPLRLRGTDLVIGSMSASVNNIAYIGIPIATYILGSAHHAVPVLAFQLGFFTPMYFVLAELTANNSAAGGSRVLRTIFTNPLVWAAAIGAACSALAVPIPGFVAELTSFLGQAAPPTVLIAFGASLVGQSVHVPPRIRWVVVWAAFSKLIAQPTIAGGVGWLLGLRGPALAAVILMGALPTAQNVFIAASRVKAGKEIAQGAVLATTILTLPLILAIVAVLTAVGVI